MEKTLKIQSSYRFKKPRLSNIKKKIQINKKIMKIKNRKEKEMVKNNRKWILRHMKRMMMQHFIES